MEQQILQAMIESREHMDTKFNQLVKRIDSLEKKFDLLESRVKNEQFQDDILAHMKVQV
ncbi:hypothetical protein JOC86_002265 [Bacillus pakistanensis]|uniref:Uncharacterized protein n=1 Tax=Rossellomorea pakistanensis TaxID=992288 RepID=A0ABS2NCX6_9BACI|nr:hypothetical protein [Bacillus pakistanensis]MBM7585723.1 hypothetical protein [Bacillus pakistanensis]